MGVSRLKLAASSLFFGVDVRGDQRPPV